MKKKRYQKMKILNLKNINHL